MEVTHLPQQSGEQGFMDFIALCRLAVIGKLKGATGTVDLVVQIPPLAHSQVGDEVGLAVAAELIAGELLALLFEMAP